MLFDPPAELLLPLLLTYAPPFVTISPRLAICLYSDTMSVTHKIAPKGDTILVVTNPNVSFSRQRPQTKSQMTPTKRSVTQKCVFLSPPHISSSSLPTSTGRYLETGKKLHRYVQQGLLRLKRVIGTPRPCCCSYGSSIADYQICPRQSLRSYWLSFALWSTTTSVTVSLTSFRRDGISRSTWGLLR